MSDLFHFANDKSSKSNNTYTAQDIEILEGLEPVRKRPGMYIGGTDEEAMHHLVSEVVDNAMDEAVAGFADSITIIMHANYHVTISDNGRGIPIDEHPKSPGKSALEVILTTLHSGGKFNSNAYQTAGGLHGVGISVVNALSDYLEIKVYKQGKVYSQKYSRGIPCAPLFCQNGQKNAKGTQVTFHPDPQIFGQDVVFKAYKIYEFAKSKAYLYKGVKIKWQCAPELLTKSVPLEDTIYFPGGLNDYLNSKINIDQIIGSGIFSSEMLLDQDITRLEWSCVWTDEQVFVQSYCNTIATPLGGTHEQGFKSGLLRSIKDYGDMTGNKKSALITLEDLLTSTCIVLSVFIKNPEFQGQTKEKLVSRGISKNIENIIKDHADHWLSNNKLAANQILEHIIDIAEFRISRKNEKSVLRKSVVQKLKLPGKLADCTREKSEGTELFIVEGDSAGGSAKQARNRETQAILPLRGKILNVANSTAEKIAQNQELRDLLIALSCGSMNNYEEKNLRYEKIIIMTDADVDGAHIASLLMTFFYLHMPKLISNGHLYIAKPPLYRLTQGLKTQYAIDDQHKEDIIKKLSKSSRAKIDIGRFKGLGEMTSAQLKETTMDPRNRLLYRVNVENIENTNNIVENLMGKKAEKRFLSIQDQFISKINEIKNNLDI
ncbi:MAG: DNA topoisomerase IV subunit B [Rickettsiaceae bacterium]|nr:MAG: DNA topoisomerase IV subunit B [Rickettsiaceae bacterium]